MEQKTRKKIGLALSGGGARGFAHLGVVEALNANNIKIDMVAGTSAGSIVAAAYASGIEPTDLIEISKKASWYNFAGLPFSTRGMFSNAGIGKFITEYFPHPRFEDLEMPLAVVACDLATGQKKVINSGTIADAVMASCAIPGIFTPVYDVNGACLVDGGLVEPLPVKTLRDLGADVIIAVDLLACGFSFSNLPRSPIGSIFQSAMFMLQNVASSSHILADLVIKPEISHLRQDQIGKMDEFIERGRRAADEQIASLLQIISSDPDESRDTVNERDKKNKRAV